MSKRYLLTALIISFIYAIPAFSQQKEPWRPDQLVDVADLAARIDKPATPQPLIICVGPSGPIKGSIETGPANEKENLDKLRAILSKEDPQTEVILYCGCCPFAHCPNIRPAFSLLNAMHFSQAHLLNIQHNIKTDWINKGYPVKAMISQLKNRKTQRS